MNTMKELFTNNGSNLMSTNNMCADKNSTRPLSFTNLDCKFKGKASITMMLAGYLEYDITTDMNSNVLRLSYILQDDGSWNVVLSNMLTSVNIGTYVVNTERTATYNHSFIIEGSNELTHHSGIRGVTGTILRHPDMLDWLVELYKSSCAC